MTDDKPKPPQTVAELVAYWRAQASNIYETRWHELHVMAEVNTLQKCAQELETLQATTRVDPGGMSLPDVIAHARSKYGVKIDETEAAGLLRHWKRKGAP